MTWEKWEKGCAGNGLTTNMVLVLCILSFNTNKMRYLSYSGVSGLKIHGYTWKFCWVNLYFVVQSIC